MKKTLLALVLLTAAALPAYAESPIPQASSRGTTEDERACAPDARKLCRAVLGDDMAVLRCFQENRPKLSKTCRAVLEKYGR